MIDFLNGTLNGSVSTLSPRSSLQKLMALLLLAFTLGACGSKGLRAESPSRIADGKAASPKDCPATREYVATLMYLRENSNFAGNEAQAREIADQVSKGCTGAALRFINVAKVLEAAEVDNRTMRSLATEAAQSDDATAGAFRSIFQKSFMDSYLDLDLDRSLRFARTLSLDFKGKPEMAERDFSRIIKFCLDESLGLSKSQCAELAARLAGYGGADRREIFPAFKEVYLYLTTEITTRPTISDAIRLSEEIVRIGPMAAENFKQAFKFASSKKGLELGDAESLEFARKMALRARVDGEAVLK